MSILDVSHRVWDFFWLLSYRVTLHNRKPHKPQIERHSREAGKRILREHTLAGLCWTKRLNNGHNRVLRPGRGARRCFVNSAQPSGLMLTSKLIPLKYL